MNENISPEEKLLRLIRNQPKTQNQVFQNNPLSPTAENSVSKIPSVNSSRRSLPFPVVRKVIWFCFILSCLYLISSFALPFKPPRQWFGLQHNQSHKFSGTGKIDISETESATKAEARRPALAIKPYDFYLGVVKNRQIFGGAAGQNQQTRVSGASLNLIKDLSLIGIISGDNPQAVIENKKTQKTYYLNKGQFLDDFLVEDIQGGKVILNLNNQRFELFL